MSQDDRPISDQIKQAVEELDIEGKVQAATAAAEDAVFRGLGIAGQFVHERRGGIESFLDRAVSAIDGQTGGRYADQVGHLREQVSAGVASLADRRWTPVPDDAAELDAPRALPPEDPPSGDSWSSSTDDPGAPQSPETPDA